MGKVSIFSSAYNNHKRKRKKRIIAAIVILIILAGVFFYSKNIKAFINNEVSYIKNSKLIGILNKGNKNSIKQNENKAANSVKSTPETTTNNNIEEKSINVDLSDGSKIQAVYENKDGKNKFKYITPLDAPVTFNVNPSGTLMVIFENNSQSMLSVSIDGIIKKVNDTKYVSTSGGIIPKVSILKSKAGYIWCSSPKFIDDNYVAYISQVPWFDNRTTKYIWIFNIRDSNIKDRNDHILHEELSGDNVKLGNQTSKGLEVIIDNNTKYLNFNGKSIEVLN